MAKGFYSLQQYTQIEHEGDPDTSKHQTKVNKKTARVTYVGFRRDAYRYEMFVRIRLRFMQISSRSCCPDPWPEIQDTNNTVPLNKDALILW